ncbi:HU family DNA-binding protein [Ascidiimonas sp. W6]|uniref:HU family DNA-binding protein n=1 Tax=Ascidiimonas meishanensis TaxID=3128903 RepID=UPI0030EE61E8
MSVTFKSVAKRNPQNFDETPKFYALAVASGNADIDRLSELVADGSTVRQNDVYAVIIGLVNAIQGELKNGRKVTLGKLGTFSLGVTSEGVEEEEKLSANQIKKARINYRPGAEIKDMLKTLRFKKLRKAESPEGTTTLPPLNE